MSGRVSTDSVCQADSSCVMASVIVQMDLTSPTLMHGVQVSCICW